LDRPRVRGGAGDGVHHLGGQVDRDHFGHVGGGAVADVAAAAAQIQNAGCGAATQRRLDLVQVCAGGVHRAGDVVAGPRTVLVGDEAVVGVGGHGCTFVALS
jgi:hypothetical protein